MADTLTADPTFQANGVSPGQWDDITTFRGVQIGDVVRYAIARLEPLHLVHEAFRDALLGRGGNIVTLEEALRVVHVAEAILISARVGTTMALDGSHQ